MDADTRPFTDAERRALEKEAYHDITGSLQGCGCFLSVALTLLGLLLLAPISKLAGFMLNTPEARPVWIGVLLAPATLWLILLAVNRLLGGIRRRSGTPLARQIEQDLKGGVVRIHRFRATAVILAYGNRRQERNYFVLLDDRRILYLGSGADEKGFPSTEFEIAVGPESLVVADVLGTGQYLRPIDEFDLRTSNPLKVIPGTFAVVAWEDVRKTYG